MKEVDEYSKMDDAVDGICRSLEREPFKWKVEINILSKKGSNTKYWIGGPDSDPIRKIWTGYSTEIVFSVEQGRRVRTSLDKCLRIRATHSQEKILNEVLKPTLDGDGSGSAKKGFLSKLFGR